jgi:hypothetical protein
MNHSLPATLMMAARGLNRGTDSGLYNDGMPKHRLKRVASGSRYLVLLLSGFGPKLTCIGAKLVETWRHVYLLFGQDGYQG